MSNYTIENVYEPGNASFGMAIESPYLGHEKLVSASQMGMTTDPRTANQLSEISRKLNTGTSVIEMGSMNMQAFDTIPKQHFEEIRRKAELAGSEITMHAPIQEMDPSGFGQEGWSESNRQQIEHQLKQTMDKAAILIKSSTGLNKNLPVTIHGSNTSGSTWKVDEKGEKAYDQLVAVDRESGKLMAMKESEKFLPYLDERGELIKQTMNPERALRNTNATQWDNELNKVFFEKENADKILSETYPVGRQIYDSVVHGKVKFNDLESSHKQIVSQIQIAGERIHESELALRSNFDKAWKYASKEDKQKLKEFVGEYEKNLFGGYTQKEINEFKNKNNEKKLQESLIKRNDLQNQSYAIQQLTDRLKSGINAPELFQTVEDFSIDKASETFSNVALHSYKNHGENAPVVSIENLYQGMGFSQCEDLANLTEKSRELFIEKAMKEEKMKKADAEAAANKMIGVTFDVGHLNVSKKHGFTDKDLIKEAEAIKDYVNKVHLTDNFGNNDSHLPIGMGNVPVQQLLKAIEFEGKDLKAINEVGGWYEHFKTEPFNQLLEAAGSPMYSTGGGPYWSQTGGFQQSYMEGFGQMLPQKNYEMFQAGFSQLPSSLGGQTQSGGGEGRMGGGGF